MHPTLENDPVYERFQLIVNGPALFNAIIAALEFDIFGYLSQHPDAELSAIEQFVGIPPHKLRVLMHALCSTELVRREEGTYSNSDVAESLLATNGPDSWRHILLGWQKIYYPAFPHMATALRAGTNTALEAFAGTEPTLYQRLSHRPDLEATLHASMGAFTLQSIDGLFAGDELAPVTRLLDVGGGDGTTAREFVMRHPDAHVTMFDMPTVTTLAELGIPTDVADRVSFHPGDLFADDFPTGFDAVLFSHVLEVFSADQIKELLAKAFDVLPPGGKLLIYGFDAGDEENSGVLSARLSLYLNILATGQGMAYPAKDYEGWLAHVGCKSVRSHRGLPYEHALTVGTKE